MRNKILAIGLLMTVFAASAQYSDDWINYSQSYYKIKIAEDGVYRVTAAELASAGVPVNNIAINRYQLFRRGQEVAILTTDSNNDNRLDYLEFYGKKNDGTSDTELYASPDAQPHTYYNLYTDTATYMLTWKLTNTSGKRMQFSSLQDASGLTPEPYQLETQLQLQTNVYNNGLLYDASNEILNPEFDYGEGWTGSNISRGQSRSFTLDLSNFDNSGNPPALEVLLVGVNNNDHQVTISAGPDASNQRDLGTVTFSEQYNQKFNASLQWSDVAASGSLVVKVNVIGVSGQADVISVSYLKADFPQNLDLVSSPKKYTFRKTGAARGYAVIPTTNASALRVFEITDPLTPINYAKTPYSDRLEFVFADMSVSRLFYVFNTAKSVGAIEKAAIGQLSNITTADYVIISHPDLNVLTDGVNPVSAYASYRESAAGGGHKVLTVYIQQVFDQFGYGDPGAVGVRNFVKKLVNAGQAEYLLLIGKARAVNMGHYRQSDPTVTDFVSTFGHPGSDALFSVNVQGSNEVPALATGRLSVLSSGQVKAYLDKVKEMEALPFDQLWRKNLVQLSGGITSGERRSFANYINNFKSVAEGDYLGGKATNIGKASTDAVEVINVADQVNAGVGAITFFGHSSGIVTDIEIGYASDPAAGYTNKAKYPIVLVNGCNAGGIFGANETTFGEDWIRTANAGALGFIANSDFALSSSLKRWSDLYYKLSFAEESTFATPVGHVMNHVCESYLNLYGDKPVALSQVYQTVFQGDPAIKAFGADKPDYALDASQVFASAFDQPRVLSNADSFQIQMNIKNFGKTILDSLQVGVTRTFPDGTQKTYKRNYWRVLRQDTLAFTIYNDETLPSEGTNTFSINLDPDNKIGELSKLNNAATFQLFIPKGNTIALSPANYGVISETKPLLLWQSANELEKARLYNLNIDTIRNYNSPFAKAEQVTADVLAKYSLNLSAMPDSTTVYWRTRFAEPKGNEDTTWVESSFTLVNGSVDGWAQVSGGQLQDDNFIGVTFDPITKKMSFKTTSTGIQLDTHGGQSTQTYEDYQVIVDGINLLVTDNVADPVCKKLNAINAVIFDKETSQPYRPFGITVADVYDDLVCGRLPQMIYNFGPSQLYLLDSMVATMKNGDMMLLFSFGTVNFSTWSDKLKASLTNVGISTTTISSLTDGQPVIFLGRKGSAAGSAVAVTSNGSAIPIAEQAIELVGMVTGKYSSGNFTTPRIGPATAWGNFHYNVADSIGDFWGFNVHGITAGGEEKILFAGKRSTTIDLSGVDAHKYPYITMNFNFSDATYQTPPTLQAWGIDLQYPPEGMLVLPDQTAQELQEGADFSNDFIFRNISKASFSDSLAVQATITTVQSEAHQVQNMKIAAPAPGDSTSFTISTNTKGKQGENNLIVKVTSPDIETYTSNNIINQASAFNVIPDKTNPVLDVTFDGGYILDGDIVSPTPTILIKLKDENKYLVKDDTTGISIQMKAPCADCQYQRVNFTDPKVNFMPASDAQPLQVTYQPGPLDDGVYSLKVNATDASGNASGTEPYEIKFEVINESTVTNFYPYPNPFSTSTRFVFTLTGSFIPDQIKIQIMTVSGRVVREITQDEIGPLRIGNNITQYAWDGRDEFGDLLANGVYLYKVFIRQNGQQMEHRNTTADKAFKNGFGKLYILR